MGNHWDWPKMGGLMKRGPMRRGPMRWGTIEMGDQWVGGTNEMGDQWNGWCMGANWGTNEMGDQWEGNQWDGGSMRWGTSERIPSVLQSIALTHDDVMKGKHFSHYCPFVRGIRLSLVNSPHKGQWRGALIFSLICTWTNFWINDHDTGDLRRHCAHYDVTLMDHNPEVLWIAAKMVISPKTALM